MISKTSLSKAFDSWTLRKGLDYFKEGRVRDLAYDENGGEVAAVVLGSGGRRYKTILYISNGNIDSTDCSCPVGYDCKHTAALAYAAVNGEDLEVIDVEAHESAPVPISTSTQSYNQNSWRGVFSHLLNNASANIVAERRLQLFIRVVLGNGDNSAKNTAELQLRPGVLNARTGKLSASGFGWYTLASDLADVPQENKVFFRQLGNIFERSYYGGGDWRTAGSQILPEVYRFISRASEYDVEIYFGNAGDTPLAMSAVPVTPVLTIRDVANGGVTLQHELRLGDEVLDSETTFIFGLPPVCVLIISPEAVSIHPLLDVRKDSRAPLLISPVAIPQVEIKDFTEQALVRMVANERIENLSAQVKLPQILPPKFVVELERDGDVGIVVQPSIYYRNVKSASNSSEMFITAGDILVARSLPAEKQFISEFLRVLRNLGFHNQGLYTEPLRFRGMEAYNFIHSAVPILEQQMGVDITKPEDFPDFTMVEDAPELTFSVKEQSDSRDWFDLNIEVWVDGEQVIFQEIFSALARGEELFVLPSGRCVRLDTKEFQELKQLILAAEHVKDPESLSVSRYQVGWWEQLTQLGTVEKQAKRWEKDAEKLLRAGKLEMAPVASNFTGLLRPYQQEGYSWLIFLRELGLGGVLADEMGLGKTVQTIAFITKCIYESKKLKPKFLIIAPTSVVENWDMEFKVFAPNLTTVVLRRGDRSELLKQLPQANVTVISYSLLLRDFGILNAIEWDSIILDEAQALKNHQSKSYFFIKQLRGRVRFALTGTPMENNLMELWSLLSVVAPGLFPAPDKFKEHYQTPIEKRADVRALKHLQSRVKPFMLRRKKELVEKDLPPKVEQVLALEMEGAERKVYDTYLQRERKKILGLLDQGGLNKNRFQVLTSLMRLRQLCLHPSLVDKAYKKHDSAKLLALSELLEEILSGDHKVLIFSQFTSFLALVKKQLEKHKTKFLYLDGATKNRGELIQKFNTEKEPKVFLISLKAGGSGLNLTAADYCVVLDPWWNPAVEDQAVARAHRIGQTKSVNVYKFIVKNSIEEKVLALQQKKRALFQSVLEKDGNFDTLLTEKEIRSLFT